MEATITPHAIHSPPYRAGDVRPSPLLPLRRVRIVVDADESWKEVHGCDEWNPPQQRARIRPLRLVDLFRDSRESVPPEVVPHDDAQSSREALLQLPRSDLTGRQERLRLQRHPHQANDGHDCERRDDEQSESGARHSDNACSSDVQIRKQDDDAHADRVVRQLVVEEDRISEVVVQQMAERRGEEDRIESRVDDRVQPSPPRVEESRERPHRAPNPNDIPPLDGNCGSEFARCQGVRNRPHQRRDEDEEQCEQRPRFRNQRFEADRPAAHAAEDRERERERRKRPRPKKPVAA